MTNAITPQKLKKFGKNFLQYASIFIVIYTVINWWRQPVMPAQPILQFTTITNQSLDIAKLSENQPVLVYFWGTWCGVCRQTSPSVSKFAQTSGYPVVSVAVDSGNNSEIAQYMRQHNLAFEVVNDSDGKIFRAWQGQVTPSYVILKNGNMVQGLTGIHPAWELKIRMGLAAWIN